MSDFKVIMDSGKEYGITEAEKFRFNSKRGTTGRQYPFFVMDNGNEIFIHKVSSIEIEDFAYSRRSNTSVVNMVSLPKMDKTPTDEQRETERKAKAEEDLIKEIFKKSDCKHENVSLFYQDTKKGKRYFPVCDFCGHRGRYTKNDNLTQEEKDVAKQWTEK